MRSEGLGNRTVDLLANEPEDLGDTKVRLDRLRVRNARNLTASVQVLRETFDGGIAEWRRGGIVLVVVLQRQSIFRGRQVIEVRYGLVGNEVGRLGEENILWEVHRRCEVRIRRWEQKLTVRQLIVQQAERDGVHLAGDQTRWRNRLGAPRHKILVRDVYECRCAAVIGQPERRGRP